MQWLYLTMAIIFEVAGTTCLKLADGFTKLTPTVLMVIVAGVVALDASGGSH